MEPIEEQEEEADDLPRQQVGDAPQAGDEVDSQPNPRSPAQALGPDHGEVDRGGGANERRMMNGSAKSAYVGIPKELVPAMRKAFSNLCTSPSGVLFENSLLQVGVKHEYVGAQGRISIFFGNLHSTPLHNFKVKVDQPEHLRTQMQGTQDLLDDGESGTAGCTVAVKTQAKLLMLVEVTSPFDDVPSIRITFETEEGERHDYPLRLPIVATCFMEPVNLDPGAFMQRWKSLEGPDRECRQW